MSNLESADLLYGVRAIAEFLGLPKRAAQHRVDEGVIPTFRMGATICARRTTLRAWLAELDAKAREAATKADANRGGSEMVLPPDLAAQLRDKIAESGAVSLK